MQLRAVIYCRCSTEEESQKDALQKQVMEAKACAEENGWLLADQYVESRSGTTSKRRREYLRLFDDIATAKFDIIIIKSQDRLMRNTKDWYLFLDRLLTNGKRLYLYLDRKFYTTDDALITGIKAILAEEYSRELSRKIVNAHRHRQTRGGRVMLTNQVFGFEKLPDGNVRVIEAEAEIIRHIFQYCATGYGSRAIANILKNDGVRSKRGKDMTPATIRRMIRNPLYKGIFVMNRQHFDFETKRTVRNPEDQWIYQEGIVPAIVDAELWERANQAMSSRAEQNHRQENCRQENRRQENRKQENRLKGSNKGKYVLSGKLVCGSCGCPYYRTWRRGYASPEKIIVEWKCSGYVSRGRKGKDSRQQLCKPEGLQQAEGCDNVHLDEKVLFGVLEHLSTQYYQLEQDKKDGIIQRTIPLLERSLNENSCQNEMEALRLEEEKLERTKRLLLEKLLEGIVSDRDYQIKFQELEEKSQGLETRLQNLQSQLGRQKCVSQRLEEIKRRLEHGGIEKAMVSQMLKNVECIMVREWQLEVRFRSRHMIEMSEAKGTVVNQVTGEADNGLSVFLDYPFEATTDRGRQIDRRRVWELLQEEPCLTAKKIAERMNRSYGVAVTRMKELRKEGYIQYEGSGGHGYWRVVKEYPDFRKRNNGCG